MKLIYFNYVIKKLLILLFIYFFVCYFAYLVSAIIFTQGKILDYKILLNYQINFYNSLGYRKIWQSQEDCVDYDIDLIFVPKLGKCFFENQEFKTELNFTEEGRKTSKLDIQYKNKKNNIAVIGDSFAMGWGVNDEETFSSILEKKLQKKVFNFAVSGYATERELIRLKKSNVLDKVDTIIIQYCGNDIGENEQHKKILSSNQKEKFNKILNQKLSLFARLRKSIRYSLKIPIEVINFKENSLSWTYHKKIFEEILQKYDFINNKRVIVFAVNGMGNNFYDLPSYKSYNFPNLNYIDINFQKNDFFLVDGHLNAKGHNKVAEQILKFLEKDNLKTF